MPSSTHSSHNDGLYGQKDLATLCEYIVSRLFEVNSCTSNGLDTPPMSPDQHGKSRDPPSLVRFIAYALYRTQLPVSIAHYALFLLSRLKQRYPMARGTSSSPHRLFLSSLMLATKSQMDDSYSNKSWAIVGGDAFTLQEVNRMERELFAFLGWNVTVQPEELSAFVSSIETEYAVEKAALERKRRRTSSIPDISEHLRHKRAADAARALLQSSLPMTPPLTTEDMMSPSSPGIPSPPSCPSSRRSSTDWEMPSASHSPFNSAPGSAGPLTPNEPHQAIYQDAYHKHVPHFPTYSSYEVHQPSQLHYMSS